MQNLPKVGIYLNIAQTTCLATKKSYLVIIDPNAHEKLDKSITRSKTNQFKLQIVKAQNQLSTLYEVVSGHYWPQFTLIV